MDITMSMPRLYTDLSWIWPLLSPPEDYHEEAEVIIGEFQGLGLTAGRDLLHLGSGGGSLDWHLKSRFSVVGVELSEEMASHAATVNPEVEYWQGDMRSIRLGRMFDGILIHDAISYMTSVAALEDCFETAAAHLNPGGALVCLPEQLAEQFKQNRVRSQTHERAGLSVTTVEVMHDPDPADTWFETTFAYFIRQNGRLQVELDTHTLGVFPLATFARCASEAGFRVEAVQVPLSDMPPEEPYTLLVGTRED